MAQYNPLSFHHGYLCAPVGYRMEMPKAEVDAWIEKLRKGESLPPELIGYLLGKRKTVWEKVLCRLCKKPIKKGEEVKPPEFDPHYMFNRDIPPDLHQACYDLHRISHPREGEIVGAVTTTS